MSTCLYRGHYVYPLGNRIQDDLPRRLLFIGKLGRDRVFFLLPNTGQLHLPTDLLGVTPGRYDTSRTDNNMQAATGAACHQIRTQMKALGFAPGRAIADSKAESGVANSKEKQSWVNDFFEKNYDAAKKKLENEFGGQSGDDANSTKAWILFCDLKLRNDGDIEPLLSFAKEHFESSSVQSVVSTILRIEGLIDKAIQLLTLVQISRPKDAEIALALARCYKDDANNDNSIAELQRVGPDDFPDVAIELAETLEKDDKKNEALEVLQKCYAKHPKHEGLRFKYACVAQELDQHAISASLLHDLTLDDPNSIEYWGYLGNSCLQLDYFDVALYSYRRGEKLMKEDQSSQWIVSNIGNLLTNKGIPTEACAYLERALKHEPRSEYAHDRLAGALKKKTAEEKEFHNKCAEGKRMIRAVTTKLLNPTTSTPNALISLLNLTQSPAP